MTFNISNTLLVIAIVLFVAAALQPDVIPGAISLFDLGVGFVVAAFMFQGKGAA